MKKEIVLGLIFFMAAFAVVGSLPIVFADGENGSTTDTGNDNSTTDTANNGSTTDTANNGSTTDTANNGSTTDTDNSGSAETDDLNDEDDENETEIDDEDTDEENSVISTQGNCIIKIEREVSISNGKRTETIKRKIKCVDGTETEFKVRLENSTVDGKFRERFRYEIRGNEMEIEAEDEIELEENTSGAEYRLRARLRNGNYTDIKIMPDTASEIALERLRLKVCSEDSNCSIQLRERIHQNIPQVVYNIEANQTGRFLGIFKTAMRVNAEIDPETGELLESNTPWWAFLVAVSDVPAEVDDGNETSNLTDDTFLANSTDDDNNTAEENAVA